ncbi:MAG: hypothetical protein JWO94_475 [Verrucomicrobiaceae bacterium]|nr:hypothetical protein [Verrucomicrobiaceae bacterium]
MDSFIKTELTNLLKNRLVVIADHEMRDANSAQHLARLSEVSTSIDELFKKHRNELPPRLCHFLSHASFQKALEYLESEPTA